MPDVSLYKCDGLPFPPSRPPVHLILPPLGLALPPHLLRTSLPPRSLQNRLVLDVIHIKLKLLH